MFIEISIFDRLKVIKSSLVEKFTELECNSLMNSDINKNSIVGYSFNEGETRLGEVNEGTLLKVIRTNIDVRVDNLVVKLTIHKCKDEWFYVSYKRYFIDIKEIETWEHHYKCDQVDGLINCIKFITKMDKK